MFDYVDDKIKSKILRKWKKMTETDKAHFINQVAISMSVWGSDEKGKHLVLEVMRLMMSNGTATLADFGIYVERLTKTKLSTGKKKEIERASLILEGYRIKHGLSSIPHRDITI